MHILIFLVILGVCFISCNRNSEMEQDNDYKENLGDYQEPATGIVNGVEYDNTCMQCFRLTIVFVEQSVTETTYTWNTEYGAVLWCEKLSEEYGKDGIEITYTYQPTIAEDIDSCIQMAQ